MLLNKHPWQAAIEPHLKDLEALTGIKLVAEVYPEDQFRAKVLVELTSGASPLDGLRRAGAPMRRGRAPAPSPAS